MEVGCMKGRKEGWKDERRLDRLLESMMEGRKEGGQLDENNEGWMKDGRRESMKEGWIDRRINGSIHRWKKERMDGWLAGWKDG